MPSTRRRVVAVARGLENTAQTAAAPASTGPSRAELDVFVGRWINLGQTSAGPGMPAQEIVTSDIYEWAPGGLFVVHSAYGRIGDADVGGVEIIGYDMTSGAYRSRFFDSFGNESVSKLTLSDGVWTWEGERTRTRATFGEGGRIQHAVHERSDDGATWVPSMDVTLRKVG